jgi:uncharacterized protein (TIGR02453 family)
MAVDAQTFTGFRPEALQFLVDLADNNDRAWFQPRKTEYERLLKTPLQELCVALGEAFLKRGVPLEADPFKSPFRIYRDVRFSRDKAPYKTNVSASFPLTEGNASAGGYFHLAPDSVYVGGGMWHPEPAWLAGWRALVDHGGGLVALDDPAFVTTFGSVSGDRLTRVPKGFAKDHPRADLLKLKDVTFGHALSHDDAMSAALPGIIADDFAAAAPVFRLLATLGVAPGRS